MGAAHGAPVAALTPFQLELLRRAGEGSPMWGGSQATPRIRRDVELLWALGLVEPDAFYPYRLSALGAAFLEAATRADPDPTESG